MLKLKLINNWQN